MIIGWAGWAKFVLLFAWALSNAAADPCAAPPQVSPPSAKDIGWFTDATDLIPDATIKPNPDTRPVPRSLRRVVDADEARRLFQRLASDPGIAFGYPEDGCFARAHLMAKILEDEGVFSEKMYLKGKLRVATPKSPKGWVAWKYHVAPVIRVMTEHGLEHWVIDPAIADRPLTESEWVERQIRFHPDQATQIFFHSRFTYLTTEAQTWKEEDFQDARSEMKEGLKIQRERERSK